MLRAAQRIDRMQWLCLSFLQVFQNDGGLKNRNIADLKHGRLAERRDRQEPLRLVAQINIDPFEFDALFGEGDHRALDVGTKLVADQLERRGHGGSRRLMQLHVITCKCINLSRSAYQASPGLDQGRAIIPPVIGIGTPVVAG